MTELDLRYNKFRYFPPEISNITTLKRLNPSNRFDYIKIRMKTLPDSIGHLKALEFLSLSYNNFRNIPDSLGDLKNLNQLYLESNEITTFPDSLSELHSLIHLDL